MNAKQIHRGVRLTIWLAVLCFSMSSLAYADSESKVEAPFGGERLFAQHCVACHSGFLGSRAPSQQVLAKFPPRTIVYALTVGLMRAQGYSLSGDQRRLIAEYLTNQKFDNDLLTESQGRCKENPEMRNPEDGPQWNGWGNSISNSSFQAAKAAGVTADNVKDLKLKWAFGVPDSFSAWSQPVVASDRIFVGSQAGIFYSLSASTGCTYWQFKADAGIRGAASIAAFDKRSQKLQGTAYGVLFGDLSGNAYASDASTGKLLWKVKVDTHPK